MTNTERLNKIEQYRQLQVAIASYAKDKECDKAVLAALRKAAKSMEVEIKAVG